MPARHYPLALALLSLPAVAQPPGQLAPVQLAPVTVSATRVATPADEVPAAISRREPDAAELGVNLSELLDGVPGLLARDRQNYAQDTQISLRGFGARSAFGIRGLRLYLDGIPASQPDGQGQISHFPLAAADHVEVLRGPFSALYGNSSGGVIQLFSRDGGASPEIQLDSAYGSDGRQRWSASLSGPLSPEAGAGDFSFALSRFETDGYRAHSAASRENLYGKLRFELGEGRRLSLLLSHFDSPEALDPLGLTRAQAQADPRQAAPAALLFNSRKSTAQDQLGAVLSQSLGAGELQLLAYAGQRAITQYLAVPVAAQAAPGSAGGVVDLASDYGGADLRYSRQTQWLARPLSLVAGIGYDRLQQQRRGYENFVGADLGLRGALRRDEDNRADSLDQYAQADWHFAPRASLLAGLRHSRVAFNSEDHYIAAGNGDDSGGRAYRATTPVAGLRWAARPWAQLYAAYGTGFETPTFAELAYRPDGQPGPNLELRAAKSRNAELGAKLSPRAGWRSELALFETRSRDELVVLTNSGGRSSYGNAGRTRRRGAEWQLSGRLAADWQLQLAGTGLEARVQDEYRACTGSPCTTANTTIAAGNRLPGVADQQWQARLDWTPAPAWLGFVEARYLGSVPVDDRNSESAPAAALFDLGARYRRGGEHGGWSASLRVENLLDRASIGSVIVNDGNRRYYEPAPGRSLLANLSLEWR